MKLEIKTKVFQIVKSSGFFDCLFVKNLFLDFLESIWNLHSLPSSDRRFKDMRGDIVQHVLNNDDWDWDYLFIEKLSLFEDNDHFKTFVEKVAYFLFYVDDLNAKLIIGFIEEALRVGGYGIRLSGYESDGAPMYVVKLTDESQANEFPENKIPFWVIGSFDEVVLEDIDTPSFFLLYDNWDDFGVKSTFGLYYYKSKESGMPYYIGGMKMIHKTEKPHTAINGEKYRTIDYIPHKFINLPDCCSLGQEAGYYDNILKFFPEKTDFKSVLWALKDAAMFSGVEEEFFHHPQFESLIRNNEAERILRQQRYLLEGQDIQKRYQFSYVFTPKYNTSASITVDFKFDKENAFPNQIYAIIGENGVGKTQLITQLPIDIAEKKEVLFRPHVPIFSKIIAISNSYHDNYEIPQSTASFNYVYCGLSMLNGGKKDILSPEMFRQKIIESCQKIQNNGKVGSLKNVLGKLLGEDFANEFFNESGMETGLEMITDRILYMCDHLSSGQSVLLFVFCNVVSHIRYDSLLLFDEPETHLHPNAITALMNAIEELVMEYQSYCIISTHSPLIVRELLARNVYVMERNSDYPSIKNIGKESFGENLTTLTEEIFGNNLVEKSYKNKIQRLIENGYDYDKILQLIENQDFPISLNMSMYITNLIESRDEEN